MRWLRHWWWARQRRIDLATLWPECKRQASNIEQARAAFAVHAHADPAWKRWYGRYLDHELGKLT